MDTRETKSLWNSNRFSRIHLLRFLTYTEGHSNHARGVCFTVLSSNYDHPKLKIKILYFNVFTQISIFNLQLSLLEFNILQHTSTYGLRYIAFMHCVLRCI